MIISPSELKKMIDGALASGHSVDLDLETGKLLIHSRTPETQMTVGTEFDLVDMKRKK